MARPDTLALWSGRLWLVRAAAAVLVLALAGPARSFELSEEDRKSLDLPGSRYKVSPEMVPQVQALLAPYALDMEVAAGWVLDGIGIERSYVRLTLIRGKESFGMVLLPRTVTVEGATASASFKVARDGKVDEAAYGALAAAIVRNDAGSFWPEAPVASAADGGAVGGVSPAARKVHFTELVGDLFTLLLLGLLIAAWGPLVQAFRGRPLSWWWLLTAAGGVALAVRLVAFFVLSEEGAGVTWTPAGELPHVSVAWLLSTVGRFTAVTQALVGLLGVCVGTLTVVGTYAVLSLLMEGMVGPFVGALFVATFPGHAALSGTPTVMVALVGMLVLAALGKLVFVRGGDVRAHLLAAVCVLFAVFARPEGMVVAVPVMLIPFLRVPRREWLHWGFLLPVGVEACAVAVRLLTFGSAPEYPDRFLTLAVDFETLAANGTTWLVGLGRVPLVAVLLWGVGLACRPWRTDWSAALVMLLWVGLGYVVYYHVNETYTYQGGRLSLFFLPGLAWLTAMGVRAMAALASPRKWWAIGLVVAWLLAAPLIHMDAMQQDFRALYDTNFLIEA